jgi:hypothetical protein
MNGAAPLTDATHRVIAGERDIEVLAVLLKCNLTAGDELHELIARHADDDAWLAGASGLQRKIEGRE